ncbi:choline ABC transporter ATP-binding protein [Arenibaculum sp.]|jgi:glycine betaine/proline transport system ATP-binding protein|uniref:choline ABC transporter ATP-binding protein n=1 Tax=Arenibaculum sp. TaxID=2865862 RepID=UPI002E14748C|nr:choline ABC transporter ATP-binding protein [Arenibaculum sp.]
MTPATSGTVEFRGVDVVFGRRPAEALRLLDAGLDRAEIQERTGHVVGVAGASLTVREGEVCVLMGLSGSGKSTLLRCVNGLNRATRGEVLVSTPDGPVDAAGCDPRSLRRLRTRTTAMVFQQFALLPWRTVAENVGLGLELQGVPRRERARVVDEKLAMVGLERWRDARTHQLSGGMQQRVGLARAFALDAPVLLMDEPFSALDPLIRARLQDELLDLQHRLRKTIVFVSHDLDEAMKIGNRIAIMEEGRIVQHGTPEEIALAPANGYVADFVAHMNPVNVLRCASIMTPLDALARRGGALLAEADTGTTLVLDAGGAVVSAHAEGYGPLPVAALADAGQGGGQGAGLGEPAPSVRTVVTVPPDLTLREAMEIRRRSDAPIVVAADGKALGVVGNRELYGAVLGRPAATEA